MTRWIVSTTLVAAVLAIAAVLTDAAEVVELRVRGRYLSAPATVQIVVAVEPDPDNRSLRVELDGDSMFRASAMTLEGAAGQRVHEILFRGVPEGHYSVLAAVLSARGVRGRASETVVVIGQPERR